MGKGTIKTKAMTMAVAMSMVAGLSVDSVCGIGKRSCSKWNLYENGACNKNRIYRFG